MSDCESITATKVCSTCKKEQPCANFSKKAKSKDGLNCQCKECCSKSFSRYYQDNHAAQLERALKWRRENPTPKDIAKKRHADYWARNRDTIAERRKAQYAADARLREMNVARAKAWYAENKDRQSQYMKEHYARNREHVMKRVRAYELANAERVKEWSRVKQNKRRARLADAGGKQYTVDDIKRLMVLQRGRCASCGISIKSKYHIDHRVPVSKGGSNDIKNIELLCPTCNLRKSDKMPEVFANELGRLL